MSEFGETGPSEQVGTFDSAIPQPISIRQLCHDMHPVTTSGAWLEALRVHTNYWHLMIVRMVGIHIHKTTIVPCTEWFWQDHNCANIGDNIELNDQHHSNLTLQMHNSNAHTMHRSRLRYYSLYALVTGRCMISTTCSVSVCSKWQHLGLAWLFARVPSIPYQPFPDKVWPGNTTR